MGLLVLKIGEKWPFGAKLGIIAGVIYFGTCSVLIALRRFSLAALVSLCGVSAESVFLMRQCFEYHTLCAFCLVWQVGS